MRVEEQPQVNKESNKTSIMIVDSSKTEKVTNRARGVIDHEENDWKRDFTKK